MPCPLALGADTCADRHWQPQTGAIRERSAYRAPCPVTGADRALEFDAPPFAKSVRWNYFGTADKALVRQALGDLLGPCMPGRRAARQPIDPDSLVKLALAPDVPPTSLRLAVLELAGLTTSEALDKLGIRRENRSRVIAGRASILMQNRRSLVSSILMTPPRVYAHQS